MEWVAYSNATYNIFASQQDLNTVNATDNDTAIFGDSTQLIGNTNTSQNTTQLIGEFSWSNIIDYTSIRCSGARLLSSNDSALPTVRINDTFTFSTGIIIFDADSENTEQDEPLVIYQSDPRARPTSYKVGDPTPLQPNAPNAFVAW